MQTDFKPTLDGVPALAVLVIPVFKDDDLAGVPDVGAGRLRQLRDRGSITGTLYEVTVIHSDGGSPTVAAVGAGDRDSIEPIILMRIFAAASRALLPRAHDTLALFDRGVCTPEEFAHAAIEGAVRGAYDPGLLKTRERSRKELAALTVISNRDRAQIEQGLRVGQIVGDASTIARDLVNLPPNELTPSEFAERAQKLAQENGLRCEVLDEEDMRALGMGSLLGVAAGSAQPPRLISLHYGEDSAETRIAFVGKGLTFDSGGLSLKTAEGMETMKGDMGGGAAVLAGMVAVARLAPRGLSVRGYIGATENMPSGEAMRPGDVLKAMTGETIEVLNTDAEGRLVLADVLAYAAREGATHIVDFATLTGGAVVALGSACSLAAGKPSDWVSRVVDAASAGLERAWQMPLFDEYRRAMDSDVADIKNSGGRWGSALTASAFLSDFVDGVQWTHVDIAGTAWSDSATPFRPAGGTGEGVGTIVALARAFSAE